MNETATAVLTLSPEQEAVRLWKGAETELISAPQNFVALCEALDLGVRAAQILVILRVRPARESLPATVAMLLERPLAEVDPWRDAVPSQKTLQFVEAIDLLSGDELECVTPHLHHGWEDRTWSCRRARKAARAAAGITLDRAVRDRLMLLAAYRNRIFEQSPPVRVDPVEILEAFPSLRGLVEQLSAT